MAGVTRCVNCTPVLRALPLLQRLTNDDAKWAVKFRGLPALTVDEKPARARWELRIDWIED